MAACTQPATNNEPENKEVKEHRDQWRPREAQSDFLDIGKQAGIEWLSFVPQDQLDYPEYFEGLDRDQKRRLRLAPKGSDEQVLIQFQLEDVIHGDDDDIAKFVMPETRYKLWPVDWYGIELMAIQTRQVIVESKGAEEVSISEIEWSLAIARPTADLEEATYAIAKARGGAKNYLGIARREPKVSDQAGGRIVPAPSPVPNMHLARSGDYDYAYRAKRLVGQTFALDVFLEARRPSRKEEFAPDDLAGAILGLTKIRREITLEGSPKHRCTSTVEELLAGTLHFPNGTLNLPVTDEMLVRKIGGDSTIQIDGQGAEPWILIRRLDANAAEGDMRATLRKDTTFNRRLKVTSGKWSAGYVPEGANLPIVCFDYDDTAAENNLLGILKAGDELLTFEVVTRGITDGVIRRAAKEAAIKLLAGASGDPGTEAPEFEPLIGWNMGTMGQGD